MTQTNQKISSCLKMVRDRIYKREIDIMWYQICYRKLNSI